jgi:hypothetical protein
MTATNDNILAELQNISSLLSMMMRTDISKEDVNYITETAINAKLRLQ